ncbi:MAG: DUF2335 domain-containing protein [Janthinobacterium lividum]
MADKLDKKNKPSGTIQPTADASTIPAPPVDALPPEVRDFVLSLPPEKRQQATRVLIQITRTHIGPIPSADALAQYGQVLESAPDRILRMAEKQSDHRMELEKSTIRRQLNQSGIGQILAFLVSVGCIGASSWLAVEGHDVVAGVIGGTTVVGLVSVFIYGKVAQQKDLKEKSK